MAQIRPFRAYRPCQGMEERIAALPYDVYNRAEACEVVKKNPESFLAVDRAETQFGEGVDTYADCVYEKADQMLREKIQEGKFVQDPTPCFYLYELTMDGHSQTGVVGCASIDDYRNNVIKKHENTRADKEEDRIRHVDKSSMQTGPIFLAYRAKEDLKEKIGELKKQAQVYDFESSRDCIERAIRHWKRYERYFGLTLTHDAVDDILERFAALCQYALLEDRDDFLAGCAELQLSIAHIRQMELPTPENIL